MLNFLEHCAENGDMPICLTAEGNPLKQRAVPVSDESNMHKPVLAQQVALLVQRSGGQMDWILSWMDTLERYLTRWLTVHCHTETGLLYWQDDFAVGVDNDPAVFFRPAKSCGSIFLNCLMVRELQAMGYLWEQAGSMERAAGWRRKADTLTESINRHCWDERDGTYYSVDLNLLPVSDRDWLHRGAPRDYPCLIMRLDSWSSFLPLWAGIASPEQAVRMVDRLRDERTFSCRAGIRTLSRLEKMYSLAATNNPSNWRGPVWGVSNYLIFSGLLKYGYT